MKIALTGGATGGHFYPLIAVVEGIEEICNEKRLLEPQYFSLARNLLTWHSFRNTISNSCAPAARRSAKMAAQRKAVFSVSALPSSVRFRNSSPSILTSSFRRAAIQHFRRSSSRASLKIPVVIYDADAKPGKVSLWSAKFARWIAVAHPDAARGFPAKVKDRIARTGHPIRSEIENPAREGGHEFLKLDQSVPTIFVMGGSQGARTINEAVLDALPVLLEEFNVVHQTGVAK